MFLLITGGSCSGKSAYAEDRTAELCRAAGIEENPAAPGGTNAAEGGMASRPAGAANTDECADSRKIYLATMQAYDGESMKRVERHRAMRAGKGFRTVECPRDLPEVFETTMRNGRPVILLECLSNLVANEMFRETEMVSEDILVPKMVREVGMLREKAEHLVIVTNNIFEDGVIYEEWTRRYIDALGRINTGLAKEADEVWEVVCGIPVRCK